MPENAECEQPTQHETIWSGDDENISKLGITRRNSSTDSRHGVSTIFLQFHFANGSWLGKQLLLLEYLKSFPDENFTAGNLHFNAFFDSEKLSQLSFFWTKTPGNLTNWPWGWLGQVYITKMPIFFCFIHRLQVYSPDWFWGFLIVIATAAAIRVQLKPSATCIIASTKGDPMITVCW